MLRVLRRAVGGKVGRARGSPRAGPAARFRPALEALEDRTVPVIVSTPGRVLPGMESTVSGFVYCDDDNDGIKDTGEVGIAGVTLILKRGAKVVDSVVTDRNGFYRFDELPRGTYRVCESSVPADSGVTRDGKDTLGTIEGPGKKSPGQVENDQFTKVKLRIGQFATNYNFGEICEVRPPVEPPLPPEPPRPPEPPPPPRGQIDGLVWNDLNGDGVQQADEPLLGGWVLFLDLNKNGTLDQGEPFDVTRTQDNPATPDFDETGWAWLLNLPTGNHEVRVVLQNGWVQTFPNGGGPNNIDLLPNGVVLAPFGVQRVQGDA